MDTGRVRDLPRITLTPHESTEKRGRHVQTDASEVSTSRTKDFMVDAAKRITFWGSTAVWILGIILALNAGLQNKYAEAGVCLLASGLALGVLSYTFIRK